MSKRLIYSSNLFLVLNRNRFIFGALKLIIYGTKKQNLIQNACSNVAGFKELYNRLKQKMAILGQSDSTLTNYSTYLAKLALHFNRLPTEIDTNEINDYLYFLQNQYDTPSLSYFKSTVFGLRFAYKMEGLKDKYIQLPSIKKDKKLPVVLSREEVKRLLEAPKQIKHKVLLFLLYGCGLRCSEVRNIRLSDLDFDRLMLHVKMGKGRKDRYVPLSEIQIRTIKKYIQREKISDWLFNGKPNGRAGGDFDSRYSQRGVQWAVQQACKKARISKNVSVHTLRHTFATHLLEDGLDIVSIKELLGHATIETTMVYLHVAQYDRSRSYSPLDTLYGLRKSNFSVGNNYCCFRNAVVFSDN
jgi:integrase/recombinase XerD